MPSSQDQRVADLVQDSQDMNDVFMEDLMNPTSPKPTSPVPSAKETVDKEDHLGQALESEGCTREMVKQAGKTVSLLTSEGIVHDDGEPTGMRPEFMEILQNVAKQTGKNFFIVGSGSAASSQDSMPSQQMEGNQQSSKKKGVGANTPEKKTKKSKK